MLIGFTKNNKGFSLIEIMVAMIIIGIVGAAFSSVVFTGGKANTNHKLELESLVIAQDILEEARNYRDSKTDHTGIYGLLTGWKPNGADFDHNGISEFEINRDNFTYNIAVKIENVPADGAISNLDNLKQITVKVNYQGGKKPIYLATRMNIK